MPSARFTHRRFHLLISIILIIGWINQTAFGITPTYLSSSIGEASGAPPSPTEPPVSSEDGMPVEAAAQIPPAQPASGPAATGPQEDNSLAFDTLAPEHPQQHAGQDRLQAALQSFDQARNAGPEAVLAFDAAADPDVRAAIQSAVAEAQQTLAAPPDAGAQMLLAPSVPIVGIDGPCAYDTIQAALTAAPNGATLRLVGQIISETVDISGGKVITLTGGYDAGCTAPITGTRTTIQIEATGSVVDVSGGSHVILNSLVISGGSSFGAGLDLLGSSQVTLNNTLVQLNAGASGGGFYVGSGSAVTLTNGSLVYSNTASAGGGAIVYGRLNALDTASDFSTNASSTDGGNLYVSGGTLYLSNADVVAGTATGRGGGIFASGGAVITLTNSVFVGESAPCCQSALEGGGIYADQSQVYLLGNATSVLRNTATNNGGGVYLTNGSYLYSNGANIGNTVLAANDNIAVLGGGLYVVSSTVEFSGRIFNNTATNSGGGLYASASVITLTNTTVGGTGVNDPNAIDATGLNGAGLYLINNTRATLSNTVVTSNTLTNLSTGYGGGVYIRAGSALTATNSRIERHLAPSVFDGRGAGLYIYDATVTLSNTQILSNTAASKGGGVRMFGASALNVLAGSTFVNNHALNGEGGAIAATNTPQINAANATFQSNTASTDGGAIYLDGGALDFGSAWDVRFNNAGGHGGGVAVVGVADADFSVTAGPGASYLADNDAGGNGGGLYVGNADSIQLYATGGYPLNLTANDATGHGGGLYTAGGAFFDLYGQIQANGNSAGGNGGFAFLSGSGARAWLDDYFTIAPQVLANQASNGGAIYAASGATVECDGVDFGLAGSGNTAAAGSGGAIYLSGSTLVADNCRFRDNQALAGDGGAIAAFTSTVRLDTDYPPPVQAAERVDGIDAPLATACNPSAQPCNSLAGNSAISSTVSNGNGGAVFVSDSLFSINNAYLHRNTGVRGGAIYQTGASATAWISNTLVYSNTSLASFGAGIRNNGGAMTITHGTLANNLGGAGYSPGSAQSYLYDTIIWGNSVAAFGALTVAICNIDQGGTAGAAVNPLFVSPGAGENYRLAQSSPAIDACDTGLPTDLDNRPRPLEVRFDMGAYEFLLTSLFLPLVRR